MFIMTRQTMNFMLVELQETIFQRIEYWLIANLWHIQRQIDFNYKTGVISVAP